MRKSRRGRLVLAAAALGVLAVSVGPLPSYVVRWKVLPELKQAFGGRLVVEDWSAGWGGVTLRNVRLTDAAGGEILAAETLHAPHFPLKSLTGHYELGKITASGTRFHLVFHADGTTNFDSTFVGSAQGLNLSADVDAAVAQGTIDLPGHVSLPISGGQVDVALDTMGATPLSHKVDLETAAGGRLSLDGHATLFKDGRLVEPAQRAADHTIQLESVAIQTPAVTAQASGQLKYAADAQKGSTLQGSLRSDELSVVSSVTRGDTLRLKQVSAPVDLAWRPGGQVVVNGLALETAQGKLALAGEFAPASLSNLLHGLPPAEAGKLHATLAASDLGSITAQLPHALNLARDARVTGGHLSQDLDLSWTATDVTFSSKADFAASGQNAGREVAIAPVTLSVAGKAKPVAGGVPEVTSLVATLNSAFMTLDAKADSLASIRATGSLSLDKLVQQAGQFVDLGNVAAAGTGTFEVQTAGTLADALHQLTVRSAVTLDGVKVSHGKDARPLVDEPHLSLTASTQFDRTRPTPIERFTQIDLHLQSRSGTVDAAGPSLASLTLNADVDLAKVREQVGTVIDLGPVQTGGRAKIAASTNGDLANPASPLSAKVTASVASFSLAGVPRVGPIDKATVAFESSATVQRNADGAPSRLTDSNTTFTLGESADPTLAFTAAGDLDLAAFTSSRFDLPRFTANIPRLLQTFPSLVTPLPVQIPKGRLTAAAAGSWDGSTLKLSKPATVQVSDFSVGPVGLSEEGLPVRGESLTVTTGGTIAVAPAFSASLSALNVTSASHLIDLSADPAQPVALTRSTVGGNLTFSADIARLSRLTQAMPPLGPQARLEGTAKLTASTDQSIDADLRLTHVTVPPYFSDAPIRFTAKSTVASAAVDFTGAIETPLGSATLAGGRYLLKLADGRPSSGWLDGLAHLELAADVPNFPALYSVVAPASPLSVAAGKLTTRATLAREGQTTTARLSDFKVAGLSLRAGTQSVAEGDLSLAASVAIDSTPAGQASAVRVSDLRASLGLADITLPEPLTVTDLALPQPTVAGAVRVAGRLDPAWKITAAFLGQPATTTATGDYVLTQKITTTAGKLHFVGDIAATNMQIAQDKQTLLAEPTAQVTNDLEIDRTARTLDANSVKVTVASGAASVQATGRVLDWQAARQLDGVHVDVDYDLAKLWPAMQPWLPVEYRSTDLKLAGQHRAGFDIRGNIPPAGASALRTLAINGTATVGSADYGTYAVRDLTIPLVLQNATLRTVYPDGRTATPAKFNNGTLDVSDVTLDLTGPVTRVTLPRNKAVLTDVKVDVPLANDLLAKLCPLFVASREADGKLSLTVVDCTNLDPRELFNAGASMRGQHLELLLNASDLRVASMLTDTLQPHVEPGTFNSTGTIRDGHLLVQDGQVLDDLTLQVAPQGFEVGLKGTIRLTDRTLMPLTAVLSKKMVPAARNAGPGAMANLPEKLELQFDGTADHPQPRVDALTRMIQEATAKAQTPPAPAGH